MKRFAVWSLVLMLTLVCAASLPGQDVKKKKGEAATRTVQGTVADAEEKPITGAVVQLKDMRTLQVRSFISQENGAYHFSGSGRQRFSVESGLQRQRNDQRVENSQCVRYSQYAGDEPEAR